MRKWLSILIVLVIVFTSFPQISHSEGEVFVAMNNELLPITDPIPRRVGAAWYIDYQVFASSSIGVNASYNKSENSLVLYTWDKTLVFDMNNKTAYTTGDAKVTKISTVYLNGTIMIPAQFSASKLGILFSYLPELAILRFKTNTNLTDTMFSYIAKERIPTLIANYNRKTNPEVPVPPAPPKAEKKPTVYIAVKNSPSGSTQSILNTLARNGMRATFFVSGENLKQYDDVSRLILSRGNKVGISVLGYENVEQKLADTNELLFTVMLSKSRIILPSGSLNSSLRTRLKERGFRIWDANVTSNRRTSSAVATDIINKIKNKNQTVIIALDDNAKNAGALSQICDFLNEQKYVVRVINEFD